jgi:hypothetical protein
MEDSEGSPETKPRQSPRVSFARSSPATAHNLKPASFKSRALIEADRIAIACCGPNENDYLTTPVANVKVAINRMVDFRALDWFAAREMVDHIAGDDRELELATLASPQP